MHKEKILIVGGGFAGIKTALELCKDERFEVSLLSDRPTFRFYPTLYLAATGGRPDEASIPLSYIFENTPVKLISGEAVSLDRTAKTITTSDGKSYKFDILVMALGVVTNYFGIKGLEEYAFSIKSVEEIARFKKHLHQQLIDKREPDLNYVIVGGGPTGIELAGALPFYLKDIMHRHGIEHRAIHIDLVEAAPSLLPRMPKRMGHAVTKQLKKMGIKLFLGQSVQGATASDLTVNGNIITSHTIVWTAGVTNHPFFKNNNFKINDRGKVIVDDHLQAEPYIFVLGDNADTPYSGLAQTGLVDAVYLANTIKDFFNGQEAPAYVPVKPVYVIPAGKHWAAVLWGNKQFYGRIGWMLRELADLKAFHEFEPWWKASEQWIKEFETLEECPVCAVNN